LITADGGRISPRLAINISPSDITGAADPPAGRAFTQVRSAGELRLGRQIAGPRSRQGRRAAGIQGGGLIIIVIFDIIRDVVVRDAVAESAAVRSAPYVSGRIASQSAVGEVTGDGATAVRRCRIARQ